MRAVLACPPHEGAIMPMLGLAASLREAGVWVDFILPSSWRGEVFETGARLLEYFPGANFENANRDISLILLRYCKDADIIIYEQGYMLGSIIAAHMNVPAVRVCCGLADIAQGDVRSRRDIKRLVQQLPLTTDDWPVQAAMQPAEVNIIFSMPELQLEINKLQGPKFYFVGPSRYADNRGMFTTMQRLPRPIVYADVAPVPGNDNRDLAALCDTALPTDDMSLVVGDKADTEVLKTGEGVWQFPFSLRHDLLPAAEVCVTSGGGGVETQAAVAMVPLVVVPSTPEGLLTARSVRRNYMGAVLDANSADSLSLRTAINRVLYSGEIKESLEKLRASANKFDAEENAASIVMQFGAATERKSQRV